MDAEVLRPAVAGHVIGAEEKVPDREQAGEVLVPRRAFAGVVPAVEDGRGDHGAERAEVPIHVRVQKDRVEGEDGGGAERDDGIEAEEQEWRDLGEFVHEVVDRVHAHAAEPVEILGAVVHGVKRPPFAGVKQAVRPVADEVGEEVDLDGLEPERLAADRAEAAVFAEFECLDRHDLREHEHGGGQDDDEARERLGEDDGGEPVDDIRPPATAEDGLGPAAGDEPLDDEEDDREDGKGDEGADDGLVERHADGRRMSAEIRTRSSA